MYALGPLTILLIALPATAAPKKTCGPVTVSDTQIQVEGGATIPLPQPRKSEILEALDVALSSKCPEVVVTIAPSVLYKAAFPALNTIVQHSTVGARVVSAAADAPIKLAAGLGAASINVVNVDLTDNEIRFRLLLGGEMPKRSSPLGQLALPIARNDLDALAKRLDALIAALPKGSILYVGSVASVPFSELRGVLLVAQTRFPQLRLSWIE